MSQTTDDVAEGLVCMTCLCFLISEAGEPCSCGHPIYCEDCWGELPQARKNEGTPFFDEATGEVFNGKEGV